jgi:diguanylate cyclase (GGDEF)-like protein
MNSASALNSPDIRAFVTQIYRPIIRGYFGVTGCYYVLLTLLHFWVLSGPVLMAMATASSAAGLALVSAWYALRKPKAIDHLDLVITVVNLLILVNVMLDMEMQFSPEKLVYFIIMIMLFAFASTDMKQALVSIVAALGGLLYVLLNHDPAQLVAYSFIALAVTPSALATSFLLRRAVSQTATARHEAVNRLQEAESLGEKMRRRSLSDSLTGLPNRRSFFETFNRHRRAKSSANGLWLILLDLDGFKSVNDGYGHMIGDELLKAVASRMREHCGTRAHVSRMGGDEFNIILPDMPEEGDVECWCKSLLDHIAQVYLIEDRLVQISASIGCIQVTADDDIQIVRDADYALLHAKKNGKNRVIVFREEHAKDAAERFRIEQALRVADFDSEIELLFQPQIDLGQNRIIRAEALARWNSPIIGNIMPGRFIEIAEESGLIAKITLAVLRKAIAELKSQDDPIPLSINLSGHDLISDLITDQIIRQVQDSGLDPVLLEFEVTETAMMADTQKANSNLLRLSKLGHPMALDDFGTGYSNFSYLRTLPISKLKIDRSFMEDVGDPMTEKILHSLVGMARTLGVECLLEGIENEFQLILAKRVGTHLVQGYLFGMPMTAIELLSCIEAQGVTEIGHDRLGALGG